MGPPPAVPPSKLQQRMAMREGQQGGEGTGGLQALPRPPPLTIPGEAIVAGVSCAGHLVSGGWDVVLGPTVADRDGGGYTHPLHHSCHTLHPVCWHLGTCRGSSGCARAVLRGRL